MSDEKSNNVTTGDLVEYHEVFDVNKLYHIIQHRDEYESKIKARKEDYDEKVDPFVMAEKYLAKYKKGRLECRIARTII